ncbi:hypothetical protein DDZ18_08835 [Marinicauda salina]|uniref:Uncharacterized protein n=1 Tax=Marinicauda salina TaxID=2135793 RepID=A0A2U2BUT8_9PROT|nr:hypothetical protein [Marinicauda salina]PWE17749.1 hypothetical protein DDZ18_08835 [Marinicauda salina]
MNDEKYSRRVNMICPTCGGDQFAYDEAGEIATCAGCEREITRDALIAENSEAIEAEKAAMLADIKKDVTDRFKNLFKGR